MNKREELRELGYEEYADSISPELECAIVGIVTDGCNEYVALDSAMIPEDATDLINDDEHRVVEFMSERKAIRALGHPIVFGPRGRNEYKGAIVGIVDGKLLYDYNGICIAKVMAPRKHLWIARILSKIGFWKAFPNSLTSIANELVIDSDDWCEAAEDVDYNIIRAMPYYPQGPKIIMHTEYFEE